MEANTVELAQYLTRVVIKRSYSSSMYMYSVVCMYQSFDTANQRLSSRAEEIFSHSN